MSHDAALPQRAPRRTRADRIRRAHLADAASGNYDGYVPLAWIKRTGASVSSVLVAWEDGKLADVPTGKAWDAVRLSCTAGSEAIRQLRTMGVPVGPTLRTPTGVVVLVAAGTANGWNLPTVTILGDGETLRVPHPTMADPHERDGRAWLDVPRDDDVLTDADDLYGAYVTALAFFGER